MSTSLGAGDVKGSGKDGRITKSDVLSAVDGKSEAPAPAKSKKSKPRSPPPTRTRHRPSADKADQAALKSGAPANGWSSACP